jgi:hypothetical protein
VVTFDGRDFYVGAWGTKAAEIEYDRLVSLWLANGRRFSPKSDLSIAELVEQFREWAKGYYNVGNGTVELEPISRALTRLLAWYGRESVADFGPLKLKALRQRWIDEGQCPLCRFGGNAGSWRVRRLKGDWFASTSYVHDLGRYRASPSTSSGESARPLQGGNC